MVPSSNNKRQQTTPPTNKQQSTKWTRFLLIYLGLWQEWEVSIPHCWLVPMMVGGCTDRPCTGRTKNSQQDDVIGDTQLNPNKMAKQKQQQQREIMTMGVKER
jgi:hypothetical protein